MLQIKKEEKKEKKEKRKKRITLQNRYESFRSVTEITFEME